MELKELKKLIAQREGLKVDFKVDLRPQSMQDISKDIAAFANAEGGYILVGVDNEGNPVGVDWDIEKTGKVTQEGLNCLPPIQVKVHEVPYPKVGTVVAIEVPKGTWIHYDTNKRFPQRMGDRTVFMDAGMLFTLAKGRGLVGTESPLQIPPTLSRQKPMKVEFLMRYLDDPSPSVKREAVNDLGNQSFIYKVEDLPHLADKIPQLLSEEDSTLRLATLNMISTLQYRTDSRAKKEFVDVGITDKLVSISLQDKDIGIRSRALHLLAEIGSDKGVDLIVQLMKSEPSESYTKLAVTNTFMRVAEAGLSYQLAKRLYEEVYASQDAAVQKRFTEALANLRNYNWAR